MSEHREHETFGQVKKQKEIKTIKKNSTPAYFGFALVVLQNTEI